ncbi:hypothetical protein K3495_g3519 [Podosphaera aphanis]|nr:hypothetical protein K3495_g3519 [Podosphaera aphanis]
MKSPIDEKKTHNDSNTSNNLNSRETPPEVLRNLFKSWRPRFGVLARGDLSEPEVNCLLEISPTGLQTIFRAFCDCDDNSTLVTRHESKNIEAYRSEKIPGLILVPSLFPPLVQKEILSRLFHRDLSNKQHKTNLHSHYNVLYPEAGASFFSGSPSNITFLRKGDSRLKDINCKMALEKKLRWITLGGQYDWTRKEYPQEEPPKFPEDLSKLISSIFPDMEPQAAIINLYSPGDTLSLHRDVSEAVNRGLVSISFGCDAYFIVGLYNKETGETKSEVLLLHSGDVLYMTGEARFAWHGVSWIVEATCPAYLEDWPGEHYPAWRGWMKGKRINLNVRQMREETPNSKSR